ncbi:MAG: hypothetical protein H7246_19475 [Phycisphaerae bacterium]|nr:hypothetical protein [Saprospiraceae bacterium]
MYDTIHLVPPVVCDRCGAAHTSTQTHLFSDCLLDWEPGMIIAGSATQTGILKEEIYCCNTDAGDYVRLPVWIVIWHGVFVGHETDIDKAHLRLNQTDRLDMLKWLENSQVEARQWKGRYQRLYRDMQEWLKQRDAKPEDDIDLKTKFGGIFNRFPEEILKDMDPLARIVERNAPDTPAPGGWFDS